MNRVLTLLTLFMLFSCAKEVEQTTAKLRVFSGNIGTAANPDFDGGIMIFGANRQTSEHITVGFAHEFDTVDISISKGTWDFMAIGFYGAGGTETFRGTNKCAILMGKPIIGDEEAVTLNMAEATCSDPKFGGATSKSGDTFNPIKVVSCADMHGAYEKDCSEMPGVAKSFKFQVRGFEGPFTQKRGRAWVGMSGCQNTADPLIPGGIAGDARLPLLDMSFSKRPFFIDVTTYTDTNCTDLQRVATFNIGRSQHFPFGVNVDENGTTNDFYVHGEVCTAGTEAQNIASHTAAPSLGDNIYICTPTQWNYYAGQTAFHDDGHQIYIFKDLDFALSGSTPIGTSPGFRGNLFGRNHKLFNISDRLFAIVDEGEFRDLFIENFTIS